MKYSHRLNKKWTLFLEQTPAKENLKETGEKCTRQPLCTESNVAKRQYYAR